MDSWKLVLMTGLVALGGVGVGATVFGSQPAQAQRPQFRECFVARQESLDTNGESQVQRPDRGHLVAIPRGWTPVGGGGYVASSHMGSVVLCR